MWEIITVGLDLARNVFRPTVLTPPVVRSSRRLRQVAFAIACLARPGRVLVIHSACVVQWIFARIMVGLAAESADHKTIMIDATYHNAHRTASSPWAKKGVAGVRSGEPKVA